ncbi:ABC-F family ATP-binding cassette domain-containing protein [Bacteroides sp. UBA939]|uniref:ABC-F family ATP-binding cassette domain-containing protein n=1 Tax=Bacteroides sp. UBA939 TaxID=1946092 RepID=UPI0025C3E4F3|nr:ABC-F family ATP-binding cassette domain-containing protein [Bacteroides sp. UBA939]
MSIIIRNLSYVHSDKETLFQNLNLSVNPGEKIALTGNNGCGKSTFMQIIAGELSPTGGTAIHQEPLYYVPQHFGQYDNRTIAQTLRIDNKLEALYAILNGDASEKHFVILNDDWNIEERAQAFLSAWGMDGTPLTRLMHGLSGGEKTRIFLAGMELHAPAVVLLDEPTNHLDSAGRQRLYDFVKRTPATVLLISHDRTLLNLLPAICELSPTGLAYYGGNYDFFKEQKDIRLNALQEQLEEKQKALRLARKIAREVAEQKAKQNSRGEKAAIKKGTPRIMMRTIKNRAEASSSKLKDVHAEKSEKLQQEMQKIKSSIPLSERLKTNFNASALHEGKILVTAEEMNFQYPGADRPLWKSPLHFRLRSGDRLHIEGNNGSGKTTLLKLISGELPASSGTLIRVDFSFVYLDQEYSLIRNDRTILGQAEHFNHRRLPEHELKTILNRYLFPAATWNKPCLLLSGGEKMRLAFCCLMIADNTPDVFILDEPTNNLDIESIEIITATIRDYMGTVIAVSHDKEFLEDINCIESWGVFNR